MMDDWSDCKFYTEQQIRASISKLNEKYTGEAEKMSFHDMLLIENVLMNIEMFLFNGDIREETIRNYKEYAFTVGEMEKVVNENARLRKELTEIKEKLEKLEWDYDVLMYKYCGLKNESPLLKD